jgi:hypothetical protein
MAVVALSAIVIAVPEIPVVAFIPMVVVIAPAVVAVPIAGEVSAPVVTRGYPPGVRVNGAGPVTGVPFIVIAHGIPVAIHPHEVRARPRRLDADDARGRGRANLDSNRNLGEGGCSGKYQ